MKNQLKKGLSNYGKYRYFKKIRKDGFGQYKIVPITRRLAIKYYCLECVGFNYSDMANCTDTACSIFCYRFGKLPINKSSIDRQNSIRNFCMECCSDDKEYISECPSKLCTLHPFRLSGYKTDKTTLIPSNKLKFLPEYEKGFINSEEKGEV